MPIPYEGELFTVTQPDGRELRLRGWGNQFGAVFETLDGYTVVKDPETGHFAYADIAADRSQLVSTGVAIGSVDPQTLGVPGHVRLPPTAAKRRAIEAQDAEGPPPRWQVRRALRRAAHLRADHAVGPQGAPPPEPTVGNYVGLCILIEFPDVPATIERDEVDHYCNEVGYSGFGNNGSVRDYFFDVSGQKLTYTNVVTDYYTAQNGRDHYTDPAIPYGVRAKELIGEALDSLVAGGFDFDPLSSDQGGFIYALNIFYAGPTVNAWSEGLWPHSWNLGTPYAIGDRKFFDYQFTSMGSELTLGTFCHENGHMICDFPDLYDYGYESKGSGRFCLMSSSANQKNPVQVGAYLKNAAGWADTVTPIAPGTVTIDAGGNHFRLHEKSSTEYFIIENRQQAGRDASIPDAGLAIWHIDESASNNNEQMTAASHYECSVEQADGRFDLETGANSGDAADLFGAPTATEFGASTSPNSSWWDGSASGLDISAISAPGPTMTFTVGGSPPETPTTGLDPGAGLLLLGDDSVGSSPSGAAAGPSGSPTPPPPSPDRQAPPPDVGGSDPPGPLAAALGLREFLAGAGTLTLDERRVIVEQALVLIGQNYVHLPLKRAMHAADPVQALRLLRDRLANATPETMGTESRFHSELLDIFSSIRDLHTNYLLPEPFASKVAFLPFQVEEYIDDGVRRYQVAHVVSGFSHPHFEPGVEVLSWSGVPIERAIEVNADRHAGSNAAARHSRGLQFLALRPLAQSLPPDEEWVEVGYVDNDGVERTLRHEWAVFDVSESDGGVDPDHPSEAAAALGLDRGLDIATTAKRVMFAGGDAAPGATPPELTDTPAEVGADVPTSMPTVLRARSVMTSHGPLGHLRIFSFNVDDPGAFVAEVDRLVGLLPPTMLILDVRGNGGGHIYASEGLLQLFTPREITPEPTQFIVSELNRRICRRHRANPVGIDLSAWLPSIDQAVRTGAVFSSGHPITPTDFANAIGQRYSGRVACITDARCYSATDIFAAGFQDHAIGPVIGVDANTGAGGANVWTHGLLLELLRQPAPPDAESPYGPLPAGTAMRTSIRRTLRVHDRAGTPLEDLGVEPDVRHDLTKSDLLDDNVDLIEFAADVLSDLPLRVLDAVPQSPSGDNRPVELTIDNLDRVDVFADGRPHASVDVSSGNVVVEVPTSAESIRLDGWSAGTLVASKRLRLT